MNFIFDVVLSINFNKVLQDFGNQINIYELISVFSDPGNMQMISDTTYSSQTKLIGQSFHVSEHGIGYSNLAFEAKKGRYLVLSP